MTDRPNARRRPLRPYLVLAAGLLLADLRAPSLLWAQGDRRNLIPDVRIDQDAINAGKVEFETLFHAGRHIFSNRFTPEDAFGEAPNGPRRSRQGLEGRPTLPFLRFNGLDAQSCQECHNVIGMTPPPEAERAPEGMSFVREPGTTAGSGAFAQNVFAFNDFPASTVGPVRNPPHVFGLGYVQRLAEEMTLDLLAARDAARAQAQQTQSPVRVNLVTKGVSFGALTARPDGSFDTLEVEGVSVEDFVVRPFQFKGIASTIRNFVANALNFHFSVQPRELLNRGVIPDDLDPPRDEILEGEVSAISIFIAFHRPPERSLRGLDEAQVARGEALFAQIGCAACHVPTLPIIDPRLTVIDPRPMSASVARRAAPAPPASPALINADWRSEDLPIIEHYRRFGARTTTAGEDPSNPSDRLPGFTRNLNRSDGPPASLPRLPFDPQTGALNVPLYSDLKRHKMGSALAESFNQQTDVVGVTVPTDEFLTRPLWGVCDTGPWLHDGRALTLLDAVLMHEGPGSEANPVIQTFRALSEPERQDLRAFLLSLRLPVGAASPPAELLRWRRY